METQGRGAGLLIVALAVLGLALLVTARFGQSTVSPQPTVSSLGASGSPEATQASSEGEAILLAPGEPHGARVENGAVSINVDFA